MKSEAGCGKQVDLERFAVLVESYGASPDGWPEDEREGALWLLEQSAEAVRMHQDAQALDLWLDAAPDVEPSAALRARVLDAAPMPETSWSERWSRVIATIWPFGPTWQPATALAAAAVLGLTFGLAAPEQTEVSSEGEMVVAEVMLDTGDLGEFWNEVP
jgi:hypothetical protein